MRVWLDAFDTPVTCPPVGNCIDGLCLTCALTVMLINEYESEEITIRDMRKRIIHGVDPPEEDELFPGASPMTPADFVKCYVM